MFYAAVRKDLATKSAYMTRAMRFALLSLPFPARAAVAWPGTPPWPTTRRCSQAMLISQCQPGIHDRERNLPLDGATPPRKSAKACAGVFCLSQHEKPARLLHTAIRQQLRSLSWWFPSNTASRSVATPPTRKGAAPPSLPDRPVKGLITLPRYTRCIAASSYDGGSERRPIAEAISAGCTIRRAGWAGESGSPRKTPLKTPTVPADVYVGTLK